MAEKETLVERIVVGNKGYSWVNEKGERVIAQPGDKIKVTQRAANTFKHRLKSAAVAEAEAKVAEAEKKAAEEDAKASKEGAKDAILAAQKAAQKDANKDQ